jgi:hypothetical protein
VNIEEEEEEEEEIGCDLLLPTQLYFWQHFFLGTKFHTIVKFLK